MSICRWSFVRVAAAAEPDPCRRTALSLQIPTLADLHQGMHHQRTIVENIEIFAIKSDLPRFMPISGGVLEISFCRVSWLACHG